MTLVALPPSQNLINLVGALGGKWHGHTALCRCPTHADRNPSLSLRQGDRGILVTCFAGCDPVDVLRALARIPAAGSFAGPAPVASPAKANILRLWDEATELGTGLGWRYLQRRGFRDAPPDTRFHPRCPHGPKPHTVFKPALLVAVREQSRLTALQRIFLDRETATYTAKAMIGRPGQGAWRGRGVGIALALAEGFETAEAYSVLNGIPCWATLGARRLDQIALPANIKTLIIAEDNDAEGARASTRANARYAQPGLTLRRHPPPRQYNDWAQLLEDQERGGGSSG